MYRHKRPLPDRFWAKVEKTDGCWFWTGSKTAAGYGQFGVDYIKHYAHRLAYELEVGPIPAGLQLDHLCRNRSCVRPDHLEAVTGRENQLRGFSVSGKNARKTRCPAGHPYDGLNTRIYRGGRRCRTCDREMHLAKRRAS